MDELQARFEVSTIASVKTIIDALIDASDGTSGLCAGDSTLEVNVALDAIASGEGEEGTKTYTVQTILQAYSVVDVNTVMKDNLSAMLTEWEDVITDSEMYDTVDRVEATIIIFAGDPVTPDTFECDSGNSETVVRENDVEITVIGGCPSFTWEVSGTGFSFASGSTSGRTNTLSADETACGLATITVTDSLGSEVTGYVRSTTGTWAKKETGYGCGFVGSCAFHQFACNSSASGEIIDGYQKWDFPSSHAYCVYNTPCNVDNLGWHLSVSSGACGSSVTYPPSCLPMACNTNECEGLYGSEVGCVYRKYAYYEWECA